MPQLFKLNSIIFIILLSYTTISCGGKSKENAALSSKVKYDKNYTATYLKDDNNYERQTITFNSDSSITMKNELSDSKTVTTKTTLMTVLMELTIKKIEQTKNDNEYSLPCDIESMKVTLSTQKLVTKANNGEFDDKFGKYRSWKLNEEKSVTPSADSTTIVFSPSSDKKTLTILTETGNYVEYKY